MPMRRCCGAGRPGIKARNSASMLSARCAASGPRNCPAALTTTATLAGVAPLAFGIGAGAEIQRPLAIAVLGGLLIAKFLNLVALPSLAVLLHGRPTPLASTEHHARAVG